MFGTTTGGLRPTLLQGLERPSRKSPRSSMAPSQARTLLMRLRERVDSRDGGSSLAHCRTCPKAVLGFGKGPRPPQWMTSEFARIFARPSRS